MLNCSGFFQKPWKPASFYGPEHRLIILKREKKKKETYMGIATFFSGHKKQRFKLSSFFGSIRAFTDSQALLDSKATCIYHAVLEELGLK